MAIVSSFLCWNNTRTGSAVCAYYSLVISMVCVSYYVFRYLALGVIDTAVEYKSIVFPGFVVYTVMIGVSLVMLPGVYMDKKLLLLPWVYTLVVTVLYETGAIALLTTVHLSHDKILKGWEISSLCFYCFRLLANCYCFACVVSQYQELSEGRGTYDFLFKPRRRRRHSPPLADGDVYNPPYGAHLPPYSPSDPYKNFSPPDYIDVPFAAVNHAFSPALSPAFCTQSSGTLRLHQQQVLQVEDEAHFRPIQVEDEAHFQPLEVEDEANFRSLRLVIGHDAGSHPPPCSVTDGGAEVSSEEQGRGGRNQHKLSAEVHSSPEKDVYRATYVTWI